MKINPEFAHFVTPEGPAYLFTGGSEEEWFEALESGRFAMEYDKQNMERLIFNDFPMIMMAMPSSYRPINTLFNGG